MLRTPDSTKTDLTKPEAVRSTKLKLKYCEKATKFEKEILLDLTVTTRFASYYLVISNLRGRFFQIFVAFSHYVNFT